jgi:hypothetical protein
MNTGTRYSDFDARITQVMDSHIRVNTRPKRPLYHYTTPIGLQEIIKTGCLWMTDVRKLNDPEELHYAARTVLETVEVAYKTNKTLDHLVEHLKNTLHRDRIEAKFRGYVTCFCANGDLLSQWRAVMEATAPAIRSGFGCHPRR